MAEDDLPRLRELFEAVVDLADAQRPARLDALTPDADVRAQVLRLARASDAHTSRATRLARKLPGMIEEGAAPEVAAGDVLGAWKLIRLVGSGGMGAVFLAERRDGHYEQRAALKVLQGVPSPAALEHLARERQILATLSHPNIARLFDGGATPQGRPYLVMEYVEGVALDSYVRERRLSRTATLRLFVQVCEALAFAHAQLIVHCDLKPSNILVDANGRPVLLDFGIARLLEADANATAGTRAYTPRYASPEQAAGEAVGTATDIFSLGRVLGELLGEPADADLAAIVAKACAPQPAQRYASAALLALDIERKLEHRPVSARAPSWHYRSARLLRRRWLAFVVGAAFLATVGVFAVRLLAERDRALAAETQSRTEADTARAVSGFLQDLFRGADLEAGGARDTTALALVVRARERIDRELATQPATQSDLLTVLARVYFNLGEPVQAEATYRKALAVERALPAPRAESLVTLLSELALLLAERDRHAEGEPLAQEATTLAETIATRAPRARLTALAAQAKINTGLMKFDAADATLERRLQLQTALGEDEGALATTWSIQGENALQRGDNERALAAFQRTAAALTRQLGHDDPRSLDALQAVGVTLGHLERRDEAEATLREVLKSRLALHGERSSKVSSVQGELAYLLTQKGQYIESAALTEDVLAHDAVVEGEQSPVYARTLNNLAFAYQNMGDAERCVAAFKRSLAIRIATLPAGDLSIARAQNNLARFLMWLGRTQEAKPLVDGALAIRSASLPPEHEERIESLISATEWARRNGDFDAARGLWAQIDPHLATLPIYGRLEAYRTHAWLAVSLHQADARELIALYIDGLRKELGAAHPSILRGRVAEAEMLDALGDHAQARALALALQAEFKALPGAYPPTSVFHERVRRIAEQAAK